MVNFIGLHGCGVLMPVNPRYLSTGDRFKREHSLAGFSRTTKTGSACIDFRAEQSSAGRRIWPTSNISNVYHRRVVQIHLQPVCYPLLSLLHSLKPLHFCGRNSDIRLLLFTVEFQIN